MSVTGCFIVSPFLPLPLCRHTQPNLLAEPSCWPSPWPALFVHKYFAKLNLMFGKKLLAK
jgi:hypothetical protein